MKKATKKSKTKAPEFDFSQFGRGDYLCMKSQHNHYALCIFYDNNYCVDEFDENGPKLFSCSCNWCGDENVSRYIDYDELEEEHLKAGDIILPIYEYTHSETTISLGPFGCPWDSGQSGYALWELGDIKKYFNVDNVDEKIHEQALDLIRCRVKFFDEVIRGEVYGFRLFKYDFEAEDWLNIDSCWGFVGDIEYSLKYMDFNVTRRIAKKLIENAKRVY